MRASIYVINSIYSSNVFQATYWRFPASMTAVEMRRRAKIIHNYASVVARSEDDFEKLLVADSEDDLNGINDTLFSSPDSDDDQDEQSSMNKTNEKNLYLQSSSANVVPDDTEINTEDIRFRLNELLDSDDSVHCEVTAKRRRTQAFESDSDIDEGLENISGAPTKQKNNNTNKNIQSVKKRKAIIESDDE